MSLRFFISATLASLMLVPSASALSCVRPDIMRDLNRAKNSEKIHHIFVGTFDAPKVEFQRFERCGLGLKSPFTPVRNHPPQTVQGRFTGVSLASSPHEDVDLKDYPVQITVSCAGSWCGQVPRSDTEMIAFLEAPDGGDNASESAPILNVWACPSMLYPYTPDMVSQIRSCLDSECAPSNP